MIQNNSFCPVHMNKQITHICIANHKCQRKVCGVCKHEKYANKNEIILLEDFCERLKTKANSLIQNDQDSAFISLRMSYKLMLGQIEKQIKAILEEFNQQIILMFDEIKKINDYLLEISQIDDNRVHECSQTDLINFIEIISGQYLDLQNQKIESKINLLKSTKQNADNEFSNFYHKLVNILSELKGCKKSKFEIIQEDIWQIGVFEEKGIQRFYDNLQKTKFIVEYTSMGQIKYIKDGICLKIENVTDSKRKKDIIRNLEQIQHLKFEGQYRNGLRFGKWNYIWKGLNLTMGGYYDNQGQKKGMWMELFENYWEKSQITFQGIYKNGQRFDKWDYKYLNETVGGGVYDEFGIKNGCWIELYEKFNSDCQVKFEGKYYNGQKVQKWDIILNGNIIGGGKYDENETKQGAWIDLFDNFSNRSEVTEIGEYQNGYRFGKWQIVYSSQQIGGGSYDKNQIKIGQWKELHENFQTWCQVIYVGEYHEGIKKGRWNTIYQGYFDKEFKIIGGGEYDINGQKHKKWIEPYDFFNKYRKYKYGCRCQVTYNGIFKHGKKQGQWDIIFENKKIGGGYYDENGFKQGLWAELYENFWDECQVIFVGSYKDGIKFEQWNTKFRKNNTEQFRIIGGGKYDENGMKNREWIELQNNFDLNNQKVFKCKYINGKLDNLVPQQNN